MRPIVKWRAILLWGIVGLGITIRIAAVFRGSWGIDEIITWDIARLPLYRPDFILAARGPAQSILQFCLHDTGPGPLTYIIEGLFAGFAHPAGAEFWLRLPGAGASIAVLLLFALGAKQLRITPTGQIISVAIAAVFPMWIDFAAGARGYSWGILVAALQLRLLLQLSIPSLSSHQNRNGFALFCLLAIAGALLHPVHLVWDAGMLFGTFVARYRLRRSALASLGAREFWGSVLLAFVGVCAWIGVWAFTLLQSHAQSQAVAGSAQILVQRTHEFFRDVAGEGRVSVGLLILYSAFGYWSSRRRIVLLPARFGFVATTLLSLGLLLLLSWRFFAATRYFYPVTIGVVWLAGQLRVPRLPGLAVSLGQSRAGGNFKLTSPQPLISILALVIVGTTLPISLRRATAPPYDWLNATRILKGKLQPPDIVICGPNSESEVLNRYASALHLPTQSPRFIQDEHGRAFDLQSPAGLKTAMASGRNVWFVTAFRGLVRPPDYWQIIDRGFCEVARARAQNDILLLYCAAGAGR